MCEVNEIVYEYGEGKNDFILEIKSIRVKSNFYTFMRLFINDFFFLSKKLNYLKIYIYTS